VADESMESVDTGIKGVPMDVLRAINSEPISDAGPDLAISKYDQNTTVIKGTAFDSDGDPLQYSWLEEGVVLQDWQDVEPG
jgi:hypothetical protein